MNRLRETLATFEEGGLNALKYGPGIAPVDVRRSVFEAALRLDAQHPNEDLFALITQHEQDLGKHFYNREAQKFWRAVRHCLHAARLGTTSEGWTIRFIIKEDAGKGWPPFEKPKLLRDEITTTREPGPLSQHEAQLENKASLLPAPNDACANCVSRIARCLLDAIRGSVSPISSSISTVGRCAGEWE